MDRPPPELASHKFHERPSGASRNARKLFSGQGSTPDLAGGTGLAAPLQGPHPRSLASDPK